MKRLIYIGVIVCSLLLNSSCSDWLNLLPKNEQVTDDYWKSKEDVEAVVASGYYYLRESCHTLLKWGELRASSVITLIGDDKGMKLQNFQLDGTSYIPRMFKTAESRSPGTMFWQTHRVSWKKTSRLPSRHLSNMRQKY